MSQETLTRAWEVLQDAYQAQMEGDYDRAVELYQSSLELHPTAEAHTFLGWTYHFQGKIDEAIAECRRAIDLDPEFGNPYNDIGAYLIELNKFDEAIPWLERAVEAQRYEPRHFPHYNLGRAYLGKEMYGRAQRCFQESLEIEPRYSLAKQALESLQRLVNSITCRALCSVRSALCTVIRVPCALPRWSSDSCSTPCDAASAASPRRRPS